MIDSINITGSGLSTETYQCQAAANCGYAKIRTYDAATETCTDADITANNYTEQPYPVYPACIPHKSGFHYRFFFLFLPLFFFVICFLCSATGTIVCV